MAGVLYARPSDNVTANATPSLVVGAANASYPLTNIDDLDSGLPFKATGTSATLRWTFVGSQTLAAIALFNHNLHGKTLALTNNAGLSANLVVPAVGADALCINPWLDLRQVADHTASTWTLTITGAANPIAIGEVALLAALREVSIRWGYDGSETHPVIEHRTEYGRRLQFKLAVRQRTFSGQAFLYEERDEIRQLERECFGPYTPFVLIPNEDENDAVFAQWAGQQRTEKTDWIHPDLSGGMVEIPLAFEEQNAGLAL
jgi:hypothetical protein